MIQRFHIDPYETKGYLVLNMQLEQGKQFPLLQIDEDTYVTGLEIQSGINFDEERMGHCLQMGKYNALAESITFVMNLDHDYKRITQGALSTIKDKNIPFKIDKKCQILIQNDVWIGHGVTVLGGVTVHNGAVLASNAVVTKDVPPYAIVAGNPAKIIKYRYDDEQINALLKIAWWNWDAKKLRRCRNDFTLDIGEFIQKHIDEAEQSFNNISSYFIDKPTRPVALFIPDFEEPYAVYSRVLKNYFEEAYNQIDLLLYFLPQYSKNKYVEKITEILLENEEKDCMVTIQTEQVDDIRSLFKSVDYFVTSRERNTVLYTGYADLYGVQILAGVDTPVFRRLKGKNHEGIL